MYCPKCGQELEEHYLDTPGVSATVLEAICSNCGIAYRVVVDDQVPEYIDIHGEPWEPEEEKDE